MVVRSPIFLKAWKKAHELTLEIYTVTNTFPSEERYRLIDQLCRSASSVPANIAEGKGRDSHKDFLKFLIIARGSVEETKYHLLLAKDLHYLSKEVYARLNGGYDLVGKLINGLIRKVKKEVEASS